MKTRHNSPYKWIRQKPYCCVPACLSMVLDRRKIEHGSQEQIGYELGLTVPPGKEHLFNNVRVSDTPPTDAGYGTQVGNEQYSINNYFMNNNINLKETYYTLEGISNVKEFIFENIKENNDIIVCFNIKIIYEDEDYGHVCILESLDGDSITLVDSDTDKEDKQRVIVKLSQLIEAIIIHSQKNRGGFWVISER